MKNGIHPDYAVTSIRCACGNEIEVGSTKSNIRVEICSKCHPFFTGKQKLIDTAGRIERFRKNMKNFKTKRNPRSSSPPPTLILLRKIPVAQLHLIN